MRIPRKYKKAVKEHMAEKPLDWSIYTIAELIDLKDPTLLLMGLTKEERLLFVERGRVLAKDCLKGLWND